MTVGDNQKTGMGINAQARLGVTDFKALTVSLSRVRKTAYED